MLAILAQFESRSAVLAHVAQLVEHTLGKGEVSSSNLLMGSSFICRVACYGAYICLYLSR